MPTSNNNAYEFDVQWFLEKGPKDGEGYVETGLDKVIWSGLFSTTGSKWYIREYAGLGEGHRTDPAEFNSSKLKLSGHFVSDLKYHGEPATELKVYTHGGNIPELIVMDQWDGMHYVTTEIINKGAGCSNQVPIA